MTQPIQTGQASPLLMAVTMRKPLPEQQAEKRCLLRGPRSVGYALIFGAAIYFALMGTWSAVLFASGKSATALALLGMFFGTGLCVLAQILHNRRSFLRDEKNYRRSLFDEPAEKLLEVYDDRLEVIFPYGTSVYPFCRIKRVICTDMMMIVCVAGDELVIRGEDLTAQDAQTLFAHMVHRLPPDRMRAYRPLRGFLYQPLPLPQPKPPQAAKFVARTAYRVTQKENYLHALPFLLGSSLLVASALTGWQVFEGDVATVFWLQVLIGFAVQSFAWLLFCLPTLGGQSNEIFLVMLDDGIIVVEQGITRCYKQNHISVCQKQAGLDIRFADKRVFVRWQDMSDAAAAQR